MFTIVGFGKVGKALATVLAQKGLLGAIVSNHFVEQERLIDKQKVIIYKNIEECENLTEFIFLTVKDSKIQETSVRLAESLGEKLRGKYVCHCSGIYSDSILHSIEKMGASVASAHPLQTFYKFESDIFDNIYWIVQSKNFGEFAKYLKLIGGTPVEVNFDENTRSIYHASAVSASNYMNLIVYLAKQLIFATGLDPKVLEPLLTRTLKNNLEILSETDNLPLTGPIIRKDFESIENHLNSLNSLPFLKKLYCQIGIELAKVALSQNLIKVDDFDRFHTLFSK